ncbi:IclR family transcriptional regulator [Pontivivens nitratireducens]|uniref:Helix-turn-helix domain-containing protein n=1 Tax=Pontivivens nitratireducens TaxID=2758038 RepID=A0A6G7VR64_9RHOB|nr:helix-turn-helix domain-containing protein [Pontibrevibacter nitratireducens]QIK42529.1 helix-turn-helix domain-containing protein [Pontibrevibacter nitratireducens]
MLALFPTTDGRQVHVVKSVARTLETLELFDELRRPVNIVEVAMRLGYPQSSTSALLKSMVALGFLTYDNGARTYYPTDRVPLIGSWMSPALFGGGALLRLVDTVVERSGLLCLLGAQNGDHALYYHVSNPKKSVAHHIAVGTRRPLGASGVGYVLLSTMDDNEIRRMFRRINAYRPDGQDPLDIEALINSVQKVREQGYFVSIDQVVQGSGLIAMLLPRECTDRPLAIGLGAPTSMIQDREHELVSLLREEIDKHFGSYVELAERRRTASMWKVPKEGKIRGAGMR